MSALGASETTARIASYCRAEQLVFALAGDGAARVAPPAAAAVLLAVADHAAWRAKRWFELLPTAPPGPDALLRPNEADHQVASIARDRSVDGVTLLAVLAVELLPRLGAVLDEHLARTSPVSDSAVERILGIARTDLERDLGAVRDRYEAACTAPADRERADAAAGAVAAAIARLHWPVPAA